MKNAFYLLACLMIFLLSCTSTTQLRVLQPAAMTMPEHINTIATIDHSSGGTKMIRNRAIEGVSLMLTRTPRFNVKSTGVHIKATGDGLFNTRFPDPLPWSQLTQLCEDYGADAIIALERFNSDISVDVDRRERKKKDKEGNETIEIYYDADQEIDVRTGWRIYDPKNRTIIDEFVNTLETNNDSRGDSEEAAEENLPHPGSYIRDMCYEAGQEFGERIAPVWITVDRSFYTTAKEAKEKMKQAARYAQEEEWERAVKIWEEILQSPVDNKTKGRVAHNIAIAKEQKGLLELAKEWAKRAYYDYGNNTSKSYIRILENRIYDRERLNQQLKKDKV